MKFKSIAAKFGFWILTGLSIVFISCSHSKSVKKDNREIDSLKMVYEDNDNMGQNSMNTKIVPFDSLESIKSRAKKGYPLLYNFLENNRTPYFIGNQNILEKDMSIDEITKYYETEPEVFKYNGEWYFFSVCGEFDAYPVIKTMEEFPDDYYYKYSWELGYLNFGIHYVLTIFYRNTKDTPVLIPICGYILDKVGLME